MTKIDPMSIRVPTGDDILTARPDISDYYDRGPSNDLEVLQRAFKALCDTLPGEQRLQILNILRGCESEPGDWPYYVAKEENE